MKGEITMLPRWASGTARRLKMWRQQGPDRPTMLDLMGSTLAARRFEALKKSGRVSVGIGTYGSPALAPGDTWRQRCIIGNYCSIADGVEILTGGNHRLDWVTTYPLHVQRGGYPNGTRGHPTQPGPVIIGNDVWIGRAARILAGTHVGDGAVIGAYSVVTRDVAPYSVVAGVPARHLRYRFDAAVVESLHRIRWWEWSENTILERMDELCSPDVASFCARYDCEATAQGFSP